MLRIETKKHYFRVNKRSDLNSIFIIIEELADHDAEYKIINESATISIRYW